MKSIGEQAFRACTGLTSVALYCKTIENWFSGLDTIRKVIIGDEVTSIGDEAFRDCSGLTSVTIGNGVTSIGYDAFDGCEQLSSVYISDLAAWCNIIFEGSDSHPFGNSVEDVTHLFLNDKEIKNLVIPNSVTSIEDYTFYNCSGLTSITIPNSVTSIGVQAFRGWI